MFDSLFSDSTTITDAALTPGHLIISLLAAIILGLVISWVYFKTHKEKNASSSFILTLVILPAIISIIILLVGSNIARAFSLAGAFSIIRFRSAPGDPKDITYVLFSLAVGLACGMGYMTYGVIFVVIISAVLLILQKTGYGQSKADEKTLKITIPENLDYPHAFDDLMEQYAQSWHLRKVRTTDLGSLYELVYTIILKADSNEKTFIDELRCRNGNLTITLVLSAQTSEYTF